jgi:hypothetical protein
MRLVPENIQAASRVLDVEEDLLAPVGQKSADANIDVS